MKKSKVMVAIVLAAVLLITILNVPTFSWFTRPYPRSSDVAATEAAGDKMMLVSKNAYPAYNGKSVTISTNSSDTGVAIPNSYTTACSDSESLSGSGIRSFKRKYYCTTITNSSGSDQNVSLFVRTLSIPTSDTNGTLALGVNGPTRSYRDYSALATPTSYSNRDSMRIYFQKSTSSPPSGWTGSEYYICWNEDPDTTVESLNALGTNGTYYHMTYCGASSGYYNYYADIPKTATHAFFACENWAEGKSVSELTADNWKKRTQTLYNLAGDGQTQTQSKLYQLTNTVSNGNTLVDTTSSGAPYSVTGNCINHYYNTIFVATGNTFDAALSNTTNIPLRTGYSANYIGGSLKYYSGNTSIFTVGEDSGVITPVAAGEAKLYTKSVGGSFSDDQQVESTVHVTSAANYVFNDVPIVKNVKIPGDTTDDKNIVKVYWYVINNSVTNALAYTIDEVYVGL